MCDGCCINCLCPLDPETHGEFCCEDCQDDFLDSLIDAQEAVLA